MIDYNKLPMGDIALAIINEEQVQANSRNLETQLRQLLEIKKQEAQKEIPPVKE